MLPPVSGRDGPDLAHHVESAILKRVRATPRQIGRPPDQLSATPPGVDSFGPGEGIDPEFIVGPEPVSRWGGNGRIR